MATYLLMRTLGRDLPKGKEGETIKLDPHGKVTLYLLSRGLIELQAGPPPCDPEPSPKKTKAKTVQTSTEKE